MLETQRINYLQQMGIQCWIPKQPLEFAPNPRWIASKKSKPTAPTTTADNNSPNASFTQLLADTFPSTTATTHTNSTQASAQQPAPAQPQTPSTPQFELVFIRLNKHSLWVCDNLAQKQTLQNLVASIMREQQQPLDPHMPIEFKWPYLKTHQQEQSASVAKRALAAQWQVFIQDGITQCFAFGKTSQQWLSEYNVICLTPDLTEVFATASGKRQLWHTLSEQQF